MSEKHKHTQATIRFMMPVYNKIRIAAKKSGLSIASWIRVAAIEKLSAIEAQEDE